MLVDVFTFDRYNCKNVTPNVRNLLRSRRRGLEIIGIHTPETRDERDRGEVVRHLATLLASLKTLRQYLGQSTCTKALPEPASQREVPIASEGLQAGSAVLEGVTFSSGT